MRAVAAALALLALQDEKPVFEDSFDGKLGAGWSWVREDPAGHQVDKGALRLKAAPGTIWEKVNTAPNLLLRKVPAAGIGLSTSVEAAVSFAPLAPAEQAGLLLRVGDDLYAKLVVERLENAVSVVLATEVDGRGRVLGAAPLKAKSVRLRLSWEGNKVIAEIWPEGAAEWSIMGYGESPFQGEKVELLGGLLAHGGPAEGGRWAEFRGFKVRFFE